MSTTLDGKFVATGTTMASIVCITTRHLTYQWWKGMKYQLQDHQRVNLPSAKLTRSRNEHGQNSSSSRVYKTITYQTYTTRQEQNLPRTGIIECIAYQNLPSPNLPSLKLYKTIIYQVHNLPIPKLTKRFRWRTSPERKLQNSKLTKRIAFWVQNLPRADRRQRCWGKIDLPTAINSRENLQTYQTIASATLNFPELTSHWLSHTHHSQRIEERP